MNTTQHTPGPWKPLLQALAVCTDNSAPKQANICLMDRKSQNVDQETMQANARLIAAAPDLLAACQKVHDNLFVLRLEYQHLSPGLRSDIQHQLDMLRSAIAQATGNQLVK